MNNKAIISEVNLITRTIEGVMLPDSTFGISLQQLREIAFPSTTQNNALRELKAACGKDFQLLKSKTEISNNPQWIIKLEQLSYVLTELAFKGHKEARELVRELSNLSLHQLFCDSFNIKFEKEERNEWIKNRNKHKEQYHPLLTRWLGRDGIVHPYHYGQKVNEFKKAINLPIQSVNEYNTEQLDTLNESEIRYDAYRFIGKSHKETLELLR